MEGRVGGWYDTPLTDLGRAQAERTGRFLRSAVDSDDVELFSSDLKCASETAEIIFVYPNLSMSTIIEADLPST